MITLKTLKKVGSQKVFDQVATHLLTQKKKSRKRDDLCVDGYSCVYRGNKGLKCAAGCLISDEEFEKLEPEANTYDWDAMIRMQIAPAEHGALIGDLQAIHDTTPVKKWYESLERLAEDYHLSKKALKQFKNK